MRAIPCPYSAHATACSQRTIHPEIIAEVQRSSKYCSGWSRQKPSYSSTKSRVLPLDNTDILQQASSLTGANSLHLLGTWCTIKAVIQLIAESAASQKAVYLPLSLAVTLHHDSRWAMNKTNAIIRLVHLLAALTTATHKGLLQITLEHLQRFHALKEFISFLRGNRHGFIQSPHH